VEYDYEKNTVTILGPFDAQKLIKKICCKAHTVIEEDMLLLLREGRFLFFFYKRRPVLRL